MGQATEEAEKTAAETHLVLFSPLVMFLGQSMYAASTLAIYWFFKDVVPPDKLRPWVWIAACGLTISMTFAIAFAIRRPGPAETLRVWRSIDKRLTHVFDLIAVCAIFLLFPYGEEKHRMVALAYCVGYGPMQLIVDPENMWANRISVVSILGAFAIHLWWTDNPAALVLTVLFVLYGGMLIVAADTFRNAVSATVRQKNESELAERRMRQALEETARSRDAKTRFIASASHDLGQPLQAASLFARQVTSDNPATVQGLNQAISQALLMIRHMLHFLRLESDSVKPNLSTIDVSSLLLRSVEMRSQQAEEEKMKILTPAASSRTIADEQLLLRAVDNLIGNAIQHSGGDKVLVGIKSAGPGKLRIWVIDNGVGLRAGEEEIVFEDYAQGSNSKAGGFGLGLSSVRRIAQLLGGNAGIDPRWRKGCAAYIELARAR